MLKHNVRVLFFWLAVFLAIGFFIGLKTLVVAAIVCCLIQAL